MEKGYTSIQISAASLISHLNSMDKLRIVPHIARRQSSVHKVETQLFLGRCNKNDTENLPLDTPLIVGHLEVVERMMADLMWKKTLVLKLNSNAALKFQQQMVGKMHSNGVLLLKVVVETVLTVDSDFLPKLRSRKVVVETVVVEKVDLCVVPYFRPNFVPIADILKAPLEHQPRQWAAHAAARSATRPLRGVTDGSRNIRRGDVDIGGVQ